MIIGVDLKQRVEFISSQDISEPKTVFIFKPLSGFEMMGFMDLSENNSKMFDYLNACIESIQNAEGSKEEYLKSLPIKVIAELLNKALEVNNLSVADKKK